VVAIDVEARALHADAPIGKGQSVCTQGGDA
jgi:hypothetical protein